MATIVPASFTKLRQNLELTALQTATVSTRQQSVRRGRLGVSAVVRAKPDLDKFARVLLGIAQQKLVDEAEDVEVGEAA